MFLGNFTLFGEEISLNQRELKLAKRRPQVYLLTAGIYFKFAQRKISNCVPSNRAGPVLQILELCPIVIREAQLVKYKKVKCMEQESGSREKLRVEGMSFDQAVAMSFIKSFPEIDRKKMEAVRWTTRALLKSFIFATNGSGKVRVLQQSETPMMIRLKSLT